jgi:5'-methylthioadenosine phosphorylase
VGTPYGPSPTIIIGDLGGKNVAFLQRNETKHMHPPHNINYRANIWALYTLGVERVLVTDVVGAINLKYNLGDLVVPLDFIDLTKSRDHTFYDDSPVTHIDVSVPYCPDLSANLLKAAGETTTRVWHNAVYLCVEGPRYETPAETRMFRRLGCDIVGMTGIPELVLARELEMCYTSLCLVTNMASGLQDRISAELISEASRKNQNILQDVLTKTVKYTSWKRSCSCARTLEGTRI